MTDKLEASCNQFILETECPFIDEFEVIFQNLDKLTPSGCNYDTTEYIKKDFNHVTKWVQDKCYTNKIPIKNLKINMSWCIDYNEGGYQGLHSHGDQAISVVFHLDDQPDLDGKEKDKASYGMLYTIMPEPNGSQIVRNYISKRGQCIILDGKVFHGVYPVKGSRRTVVIDFDYAWLDPDEKIW